MTKIRLIGVLTGLAISLGFLSVAAISAAQEIQILDIITEKELEELDIEIPEETPFGYNELIIDVYEGDEIVVSKRVGFCKEQDGFINWNNQCTGPIGQVSADPTPVAVVKALASEDSVLVAILAFAALLIFGSMALGIANDATPLPGLKATGSLAMSLRDLSGSLSRSSSLLGRVMGDGTWLRSRIGYGTLIVYLAAATIVVLGLNDNSFDVLPLTTAITLALVLISTIDALAGWYAGAIYLLSLLVAGNIDGSLDLVFATLYVLLIAFVRPLTQIFVRSLDGNSGAESSAPSRGIKVGVLVGLFSYLILELLPYTTTGDIELANDAVVIAIVSGVLALVRTLLSRESELISATSSSLQYGPAPRAGRVIDLVLSVVVFIGVVKTLFEGTVAMWPTILLAVLIVLNTVRLSARAKARIR